MIMPEQFLIGGAIGWLLYDVLFHDNYGNLAPIGLLFWALFLL